MDPRRPVLWIAACLVFCAGGAAAQPSAAEVEFWRSTERLGTPEAYRAYLAAFPGGLYAPLARAALGSGASPAPAAAAPAAAAAAARPATTLRYFSEPPDDTGAIAFNIGDRFSGPGALGFGRLGARRQIVLPEGDWVVLAGTDWRAPFPYNLRADRYQVAMSTVVFGKFAGDRLVTMLRYSANTRPPPTLGSNSLTWSWADYAQCDANTSTRLFHERTRPDASRDECTSIWVAPDPLSEPWPGNESAKANVARLGGSTRGAAIVTTLTFAEQPRYGYLGIVRVDWPNLGPDSEAAGAWQPDEIALAPARRSFIKSTREWAAEYRKAALAGFRRDYPGDDLTPVATFR